MSFLHLSSPLQKNIYLFNSSLPCPKRLQNLSPVGFTVFSFLTIRQEKLGTLKKTCQLGSRVAGSRELKILTILVFGRFPPHSSACNGFGAVLSGCLNAEFLNTVVNTALNNNTYDLMTALCAART